MSSHHRSVYLPLLRGLTPTSLDVFDFAEQGMVTGYRDTTTVPQQALYMLNDPFVQSQSLALAQRLLALKEIEYIARIHRAYRLTLGRTATTREIERAVNFLADYEDSTRETYAVAAPEPAPVTTSTSDQTQSSDTGQKADPAPKPNRQEQKQPSPPLDPKTAAWSSFCQALLGAAEFRYLK